MSLEHAGPKFAFQLNFIFILIRICTHYVSALIYLGLSLNV